MPFTDTIAQMWRNCDVCIRLIAINVAVFAIIMVAQLGASLCNSAVVSMALPWIECPAGWLTLLSRPWTLLTYMFVHVDIFHLIFNMLWLYMFGSVFMLTGMARQLITLYLGGGFAGALFFLSRSSFYWITWGSHAWLVGSSASVMAIITATAILHPNYRWNMILIGEVALKWVAVVIIALTLIGSGSFAAHAGGAIAGVMFAVMLKRGTDLSIPFEKIFKAFRNTIPTENHSSGSRSRYNTNTSTYREAELDEILDKVRRSGYSSLSASEKKRLIELSRPDTDLKK